MTCGPSTPPLVQAATLLEGTRAPRCRPLPLFRASGLRARGDFARSYRTNTAIVRTEIRHAGPAYSTSATRAMTGMSMNEDYVPLPPRRAAERPRWPVTYPERQSRHTSRSFVAKVNERVMIAGLGFRLGRVDETVQPRSWAGSTRPTSPAWPADDHIEGPVPGWFGHVCTPIRTANWLGYGRIVGGR